MSEKKEFKTETKRLLDLMINSIYTNKEIFIRELVSNASDAIDKYHYLSLTDEAVEKVDNYEIRISLDKENRTLTISDNGIGMTKDELENHLGTIAKSGSLEFMKKMEDNNDTDIIGQFGVGFYSAFMVCDKVVVDTLSPYSNQAYRFTSDGTDSYYLDEISKDSVGTEITLYLRENKEDENYDEFLDQFKIKRLIKKYSDYIRYPIKMNMVYTHPQYDDNQNKTGEETEIKEEILNSMIPIWKKNKSEVKEEDLISFYKQKFNDYEDPLLSMHINVEGNITYNALVFIPGVAPYNLYSDKFEKGLQLYTKSVFIMDKCKDLVPDYLRFIKGLVDSADLSLNISREILQQNKQLAKISSNIEKKVISELEKLLKNDYNKYLTFFDNYGLNIKYGIYESYGAKKELLENLLVYQTLNNESKITLKEYVNHMKEDQKVIYYASAKNKEQLLAMPQLDALKKHEYDCLILSDDIDEFLMSIMNKYNDIEFKSINQGDLDLLTDEEKDNIKKIEDDSKDLLGKIKEALSNEVSDVVISKRLVDSPVCLVSGEGLSFEMEKVLKQMPNQNEMKASRILEINANHDLFKAIEKISDNDDLIKDYALLLFDQALLMEGLEIKNPVEFSNRMCKLMILCAK